MGTAVWVGPTPKLNGIILFYGLVNMYLLGDL